jgi:osmotically-inducible protein OsmY
VRTLLVFLIGLGLGALAFYLYREQPQSVTGPVSDMDLSDKARDAAHSAANKTREVAGNVSETMSEKIKEWHLTRDDIKADLAKAGQVVRHNASRAGEKISDARIVTVVRAKYVLDRELSLHDFDVACTDGKITLTGSVSSEALIGKAVAIALDTEGVQHVTSKLTVQAKRK